MKWAVAQGYREDNPAGDVLSAALPNNRIAAKHQRALPHAEVGAALARVRTSGTYPGTVLSFEFLVLTAARSGEVRNARWTEIDRAGAVWTVPGERMKAAASAACRSRPGRSKSSTRRPSGWPAAASSSRRSPAGWRTTP